MSALDAAASVPAVVGIVGMLLGEIIPELGFSWRPIQRTGEAKVYQRSPTARILFHIVTWSLVLLGFMLAVMRRAAFPPQTSIPTAFIAVAIIAGGKMSIHGRATRPEVVNGPVNTKGSWDPAITEWLDQRLKYGVIAIAVGYTALGVLLSASHSVPVLVLTGFAFPPVGIYLVGRQRMHIHPDAWVANLGIVYWTIGWAIILYGISTATS